jgi:probable HAF family extracellular repeat protein
MKHSLLISTPAISLSALLLVMPLQVTAREQTPQRYTVIDLGPLGTTFSEAVFITNEGLVSGTVTLPNGTEHAALWHKSGMTDIGTPGLGGVNSAALNSSAFGVTEGGQSAGQAETSKPDPQGEDFCGYFTSRVCLPFVWQHGAMTALPTLGGANGSAGLINDRGEVAGYAENNTLDTTCLGMGTPQVFQEKPVIWKQGKIQELPTLAGDPDGWAFGINHNGQAVGASGICSTLNPDTVVYVLSRHALLWEPDGSVKDLGNLGGTGAIGPGNVALAIDNRGQVVGVSGLVGDTTFHGYLWTRETSKMRDLGTLSGDVASIALGINDEGEVVGASFDASGDPRAFLRQRGTMIDLNELVSDSPLYLLFAHGINSRREIVGFGATSAGDVHAFLASPVCDNTDEADNVDRRRSVLLSDIARKHARQQLRRGYLMGGSL